MAKFLSEDWGTEVRDALSSSSDATGATKGVQLVVQQVVSDVPEKGETKYWTKFNDGTIEGADGENPDADFTISQNYETASALNKGELNAQAAFMQSKIKVSGNMGKLLQHQGLLQTVMKVVGSVPTEY